MTMRSMRFDRLVVLLLCFAAGCSGHRDVKRSSEPNRPVAFIAGSPLQESELLPTEAAQLHQAEARAYEEQRRIIQTTVNRKLLELEEQRSSMSLAGLLRLEATQLSQPDAHKIVSSMLARVGRAGAADPAADSQQRPTDEETEVLTQRLIGRLRAENEVRIALQPPRVALPKGGELRGTPDAPIAIVEFSDFECPYSRVTRSILAELLKRHSANASLTHHDFPIRQIHQGAELKAEAARCAGDQGKFWSAYDQLFANSDLNGLDGVLKVARILRINERQFQSCVASGKYRSVIDSDIELGLRSGVTATPTVFINGIMLFGLHPPDDYESLVQEELAATVAHER